MWSRKRRLRKEKKHLVRKIYFYLIILSGILGIVMMVIGVFLVINEPLFESPIPLFTKWALNRDKSQEVVEIKKFLEQKSIEYIDVSRESSKVYKIDLKNNGEVVIDSEKGLPEQLSSLQVILSRLTMEGKKFKRLDLTYDRPVLVLQ